MTEIKAIKISGFRGINTNLSLNFEKGKSVRSMVIYGRNGTGKSSITDAWEWFHTEKIEHLRREGAGPSSYPNINAAIGQTFVEIDFVNKELGTIRLSYDNSRITKPNISGQIEKFYKLAPHPCHIRFEDLTRFVYLTKSEKFDALAQLMGFMPQVEMQKSLRRVSRNFNDQIQNKKNEYENTTERLKKIIDIIDTNEESYLNSMNKILKDHGVEPANSIDNLQVKHSELNNLVINDPRTQRLNILKSIISTLTDPAISEHRYLGSLNEFITSFQAFLNNEKEVSKLLLLDLYEQGEKIISLVNEDGEKLFSKVMPSGIISDVCPLCGQIYEEDLSNHITLELESLRNLKQERDNIEKIRKNIQSNLPHPKSFSFTIVQDEQLLANLDKSFDLQPIIQTTSAIESKILIISKNINQKIDKFTQESLNKMSEDIQELNIQLTTFEQQRSNSIGKINSEIANLGQEDKTRTILVDDNTKFKQAIDLWNELTIVDINLQNQQYIFQKFTDIVDDYVVKSIKNVENRFSIISEDVKTYFEIL